MHSGALEKLGKHDIIREAEDLGVQVLDMCLVGTVHLVLAEDVHTPYRIARAIFSKYNVSWRDLEPLQVRSELALEYFSVFHQKFLLTELARVDPRSDHPAVDRKTPIEYVTRQVQ